MKLKNLEIRLQKVAGFEKPKAEFEQYMTPAPLAARFLFDAFLHGDIEGMKVLDLGCGTGMLHSPAAVPVQREEYPYPKCSSSSPVRQT